MSKLRVRTALEPLIHDWSVCAAWNEFAYWNSYGLWQDVWDNGIAIAWEAVEFTPPADRVWLQVTIIPADTVSGSLRSVEYKGVLRINVFTPGGRGAGLAEDAAASLAKVFPAGLNADGVRVPRPPSIGQAVMDPNGYCMVPVSVRYLLNA